MNALRRVEQADDPGDPGDQDGGDQVFADLGEQVLLEITDLVLDLFDDPAHALGLDLGNDRHGLLDRAHRLFWHALGHDPAPDRPPGQPEQGADHRQDAPEVELGR